MPNQSRQHTARCDQDAGLAHRYVKDDRSVDVGPRFTFVNQPERRDLLGLGVSAPDGSIHHRRRSGDIAAGPGGRLGPRPEHLQQQRSSGSDRRPCHTGQRPPTRSTSSVPVGSRSGLVAAAPEVAASPTGAPRSTREAAERESSRKSSMTPAVWVLDNQITPVVIRWTAANTRPRPSEPRVRGLHAEPGAHLTLQLVATTVAVAPTPAGRLHRLRADPPCSAGGLGCDSRAPRPQRVIGGERR